MTDDWKQSDGRNVFEMIEDAGGPGIWVRRTTWDATCARIVGMGTKNGPAPYFGNPPVAMDVYGLDGSLREELAQLTTPGTNKTWRQIDPPQWAAGGPLRALDDPAIARALEQAQPKRGATKSERLELNVPYARKDEAKALGARWDAARKTWWIPASGNGTAQNKARQLGFLS